MYFKQFLHDSTGCSSYFIASRDSREAAVVDPQIDIQPYAELAADRGYRITHVIDTHLHADHLSGNRALASATGAELCLHESAAAAFPFTALRDSSEVNIGQLILRVMHTPGHRPEALSLVVINPPRSDSPSMALSGDTLFVGDVGRPDFGGREGAIEQYRSTRRLLELEDWVEVFPAHFEGSCGKRMCGRPSSTIGFERRFNPMLQLSMDEFVEMAAEVPPRPLNMTSILEANRGALQYRWPTAYARDSVSTITVSDAASWLEQNDGAIIDVREPAEFARGHVPRAMSLPQADLSSRLQDVPARPLLVVCETGRRSLGAAAFLVATGFQAVSLDGGTRGWVDAGLPVAADPVGQTR